MPADMSFDGGLTISMQCKDRRKAAAWYADALGFRVLYDAAEIGWCELSTHIKGVNIGLSQRETVTPGGPVPTWGVKDIASARAQLEGKGVRFDGPTMTIPGMVSLATFFDPDGNANMLYQDLAAKH